MKSKQRIERFRLQPGDTIANKYEIIEKLGAGWEGEVYLVNEKRTNVARTAKLFFPHRNPGDRTLKAYARKLHRLRQCPIVIQYHTLDSIVFRGREISVLISEYVEGELLSQFIKHQKGKKMSPFQAVHLLHALTKGIESIHAAKEYHGDLHLENIIVQRFGLGFELKVLDMFHWGAASGENYRHDICDLIRVFYDVLGGAESYAKQPAEVKAICCGLKRSLITKKFRNASQLRHHIETMDWTRC